MPSERDIVDKATHNALKMMKDAGFEVSDKLKVVVDPKLPFMGYSTKRGGSDVIVISGRALASNMVEGLLVHEMSHIYRISTKHPSHNHELLNMVEKSVLEKARTKAASVFSCAAPLPGFTSSRMNRMTGDGPGDCAITIETAA